MTGEMYHIDPVTAREPDGTEWPYYAAIARATGGQVKPFDQYQGPYVVVGPDIRTGQPPYALAPTHLGIVRLWIVGEEGAAFVYREDTDAQSGPIFSEDDAVEAALDLLR